MTDSRSLGPDDLKKLETFFEQGKRTMQEIEGLQGALKDTGKALAEELGYAPKVLMKALRTSYKNALADQKDEMNAMEELLQIVGEG